MQIRKSNKILILITMASIAIAIYFGIQNYRLSTAQNTNIQSTEENIDFEQQKSLVNIDSFIIKGDYEKALALSKELKKSTNTKINPDLDLRFKILQDFVKLSAEEKQIVINKSNTLIDSTKNTVDNNEDFTQKTLELQQAKSEIKVLKNKLNSSSTNNYITFKTSKKTNLHYVGNVKNGKANGFGIAILETGSRYEGQWKDNLRHGKGKFYWDDGEDYQGDYKNDVRDGFGTYHWSNGEKYVGEWKNDRRNGKGEFYNKRGKLKTSGIWEDDKLIEENK